jgi:hypothetical protein
MNCVAQTESLTEFVQTIETNHWAAPVMMSRWHVEHIAEEKQRPAMATARTFGDILTNRLEGWRDDMIAASTPADVQSLVDNLLWLADWLMETPGYGNLFLAARSQDLATIGIGKLVVNLEYPLTEITSRLQRLRAPWYAPSVRQKILNREAGTELFEAVVMDEGVIQQTLSGTWQRGMLTADRERQENVETTGRAPDRNERVLEALITGILLQGPDIPKAHLAFFEDDPLSSLPPDFTLNDLWNRKWHEKCVIGFEPFNTSFLMALATFRKEVGFFPTSIVLSEEEHRQLDDWNKRFEGRSDVVPYEDAFSSPIEAAFSWEWEKHATPETRLLYSKAYSAYERITTGRFLDEYAPSK